jgi:hypothetical protein
LLDLSIKHCRCTYLAIYSSSIYLRKGRGYLYSTQALNPTKEFVGLLNNGNVSFPITNTSSSADAVVRGFNLVVIHILLQLIGNQEQDGYVLI